MQKLFKTTTIQGEPFELEGQEPVIGALAPNVDLVDGSLEKVSLASYFKKVTILISIPSIDTEICNLEVRRFNEEIQRHKDKMNCVSVSMDLPFAQKRWCATAGVQNVHVLSDHREAAFGKAYGVLIKDLRLLARSVFIIDEKGVLRFSLLIREISDQPNYGVVLQEAKNLLKDKVSK